MDKILEYILTNYTWILGVIIIILLAIIGSYADKTNFGQGKPKDQKNENPDDNNLIEEPLKSDIKQDKDIALVEQEKEPLIKSEEINSEETKKVISEVNTDNDKKLEDEFEKMSQEVDEFLPKKDLIDGDLLDEIENLSLDKTQKIKTDDIPDLDDVELPEIKNLKSTDDDIWKF